MNVSMMRLGSGAAPYALGAGLGLIAAGLQWLVHPLVGTHVPYIFFVPILVFAAASVGRAPALIVLLIGAANSALLAPPVGSFHIANPENVAALAIYVALGILLVIYGGHLRFTTKRAALAEQRLALAQDDTGVGVFELDFGSGTAYVSPSMSQMLGQPASHEPMPLEQWLAALGAGTVKDATDAMRQRLASGELRYEREQQIRLANGKTVWLLNRVQLEATAAGVLTHARGAAVDITARKKADDLLQAAQTKLQQQVSDLQRLHAFSQHLVAVGDSLPAAMRSLLDLFMDVNEARHGFVSLCDPADGAIAVVAHTGVSEEALELTSVPSIGNPGSSEGIYSAILAQHRALAGSMGLPAMQSMPLRSAGGGVMGAVSVAFAEPREHSERKTRLCEVCATTAAAKVERARARAAAERTEQRFSVALESSVVPFTILTPVRNPEGRITDFEWTYLNPAAARALDREPQELLGSRVAEVHPRAWKPPGQFERYVQVIETGEPCQFEVGTDASNRGTRWYHVVASRLQGSIAVWFANITERKLHEGALEAAAQRKDEFLATLAHELRNPLAAIRQGVRIARSITSADAQKRWGHAVIDRQVNQMSLLLDDLLDVARVGRGTLLLRKSPEALSELIDTAIETARPHIEAKRHQFAMELPAQRIRLEVDPLRIAQVIGNLLINAAKYTDPGGHIHLRVELDAEGIAIRIKDSGIGLTKDQIAQVFDMFAQVPTAVDKSQGGLGVGLALARGLVELHEGAITVASDGPGRGAEFCVRLPASCVECLDDSAEPASTESVETASRGSGRVLIADDNRDAADSLAELLRLDGHEVHVAYDGEQALARFIQVEPDTALLDLGMPGLSGLEVVRAIRQHPLGSRTTLIAITGRGEERDRQGALEAGFDYHVTKPTDPEQIQALMALGRGSAQSA